MKTRNQIFWATVAIINAVGALGGEGWIRAISITAMSAALVAVWWHTKPKKKTRREAHRLR